MRRRERRAADRTSRRASVGRPEVRRLRPPPLVLVTAGAILVGVVLVAGFLFSGGLQTAGDAPLATPTVFSPISLADGRAIGRPDAPATLTVWEDFQCPLCGEFTRQVEPRLYTDYVEPGKLRIVYRDLAFIGPESFDAAAAARCAGDQGKFWPYHDYLFWNQRAENSGDFNRSRLDAIADAVGLDRPAFDSCLAGGQALAQVKAETAAGQQAGIGETPTLVVDKQVMPGAPLSDVQYTALGNVIKASITAHSSASPTMTPSATPSPPS